MKQGFFILCALCSMLSGSSEASVLQSREDSRQNRQDNQMHKSAEKIYLQPQDILIQNNQILIHLGNEWIPTDNLQSDTVGVYAYNTIRWICRRCFYNNEEKDMNCLRCGYPKQQGQ